MPWIVHDQDFRSMCIELFAITLPIGIVSGLFAAIARPRTRVARAVIATSLLAVCWAVGGVLYSLRYHEEFQESLAFGFALAFFPVVVTIPVTLWDAGATSKLLRGVQVGLLVLILTPFTFFAVLTAAGLFFGLYL